MYAHVVLFLLSHPLITVHTPGYPYYQEYNYGYTITPEFFSFIAETAVRIPRFNGHSHVEFQGLGRTVLVFTELEAVIKPEVPDGLILYNGYTHDRKGDFISLSLREGHVEFTFDLGTGPAVIRYVLYVLERAVRLLLLLFLLHFN